MADKTDLGLLAAVGVGLYFLLNSDLGKGVGKVANTAGDIVQDAYGGIKAVGGAVGEAFSASSLKNKQVSVADLQAALTPSTAGLGNSLRRAMTPAPTKYTGSLANLPNVARANPVSVMLSKSHQSAVAQALGNASNPSVKTTPSAAAGALSRNNTGKNPSRTVIPVSVPTPTKATTTRTASRVVTTNRSRILRR